MSTPVPDRLRLPFHFDAAPRRASRSSRHCPPRRGCADGEVRLHVPITTHPDVAFFLGGERVVLQPGECWYLDFNRPHRVDNPSDTDRVHRVLDCDVNDWLRDVFTRAVNGR